MIYSGYYFEPLMKQQCCLIEEFDESLSSGEDFVLHALTNFPEAEQVIVRLSKLAQRLDGFDDYLYYMQLDRPPNTIPEPAAVTVRAATEDDRPFVVSLLSEAFNDGLKMRSTSPPAGVARRQAEQVLDLPESVSLIAEDEHVPFGHVTMLVDQDDVVSQSTFTELLDMLVDRTHPHRREAEGLLVAAAQKYAAQLETSLVGHIVVRENGVGYEAQILGKLEDQGWTFTHKYMIRSVRGSGR